MDLATPISQLPKVGKITAKKLEKLNLFTCRDLLYHYPFRYEDWSKIISIKELKTRGFGTIKAKIKSINSRKTPRKRMIITEAIAADRTDSIKIVWFGQFFLNNILKSGRDVYLAGKVENSLNYGLQLVSPSYEFPKKEAPIHLGRLVPIYPITENVSQKQIRLLIKDILPLTEKIQDWLPDEIKGPHQLMNLSVALGQIHFPASQNLFSRAEHRLKFDELFLIQLQTKILREKLKQRKAPILKTDLEKIKKFVKNLPFKLTSSQKKSAWEIIKDLEKGKPMNRLLEGDVGSGKTVVATMAILNAALNNYQVAYLAPTEILANQHFNNISVLLKKYSVKIGLLTRESQKLATAKTRNNSETQSLQDSELPRSQGKLSKSNLLSKISSGELDLIIGTHSIIQEGVNFKNLGLIIVDEQHRFGVGQRSQLTKNKQENEVAHFLSMTATPIPRSLALTLYGDLDLSIIDEMPPGRKEVEIKIVGAKEKNKVYEFIKKELKNGQQAFVICPLIDPSDKLGITSVKQEYEKLSSGVFADLKLSALHGKLKAKEKDKIMADFLANKIQILISTTVIEVGIDVPNATMMLIEGAERFGLAQLWQLKGRVGRSNLQSYCFLFQENPSEKARERLKAIINAKNGFELAEKDLEIRGPGELFGLKQSGYLESLKIARLSDTAIIKETREATDKIISLDASLKKYPLLLEKINQITKIEHLE